MLYILNDSKFFTMIAEALHEAMDELFIPNAIVDDFDLHNHQDTYIVFTTHEGKTLPNKYIVYNFEQLATNRNNQQWLFDRFKQAQQVWDYSLVNVQYLLSQYNIQAKHIPFGYAKCLEQKCKILPMNERSSDCLFLGYMNANRDQKFRCLQDQNIPVKVVTDAFGLDMYRVINQYKFSINAHYYQGETILEIIRILPLIVNNVLVVSETSNDEYYDKMLGQVVTFITPEKNFDTILKEYREYTNEQIQRMVDERKTYIKQNCKYVDHVYQALGITMNPY